MPAQNPTQAKTDRQILLAHGGGGQLTDQLLEQSVFPRLTNPGLDELLDSGLVDTPGGQVAITIDSYVVQPLIFPGGDIGRLAVSGTINDLSVCGAEPKGLALSLILAEGFSRDVLEQVLDSIARTAAEAGVAVITGDTKVVGRNQADGMYITTAGVGVVAPGRVLSPSRVREGDAILINGAVADHGLAVMLAREMPEVQSVLRSDAAPLNDLIAKLLDEVPEIHFMRDATRAGLAGVASDLAHRTDRRVLLDEPSIPVSPATQHAAEMLGLDPLEVANEGKVVVVLPEDHAGRALEVMRGHRLGGAAARIGEVGAQTGGICELRTDIGGRRVLQKPYGEQLPRIC